MIKLRWSSLVRLASGMAVLSCNQPPSRPELIRWHSLPVGCSAQLWQDVVDVSPSGAVAVAQVCSSDRETVKPTSLCIQVRTVAGEVGWPGELDVAGTEPELPGAVRWCAGRLWLVTQSLAGGSHASSLVLRSWTGGAKEMQTQRVAGYGDARLDCAENRLWIAASVAPLPSHSAQFLATTSDGPLNVRGIAQDIPGAQGGLRVRAVSATAEHVAAIFETTLEQTHDAHFMLVADKAGNQLRAPLNLQGLDLPAVSGVALGPDSGGGWRLAMTARPCWSCPTKVLVAQVSAAGGMSAAGYRTVGVVDGLTDWLGLARDGTICVGLNHNAVTMGQGPRVRCWDWQGKKSAEFAAGGPEASYALGSIRTNVWAWVTGDPFTVAGQRLGVGPRQAWLGAGW